MKPYIGWSVMSVVLCLALGAIAQDKEPPKEEPKEVEIAAPDESSPSLGMSQGKFAVLVIHETKAERFFEGPITGGTASKKLATLGLAPEGGWRPNADLTRANLESAYGRLKASMSDAGETAPPDAEVANAGGGISGMTVAELIDEIVSAMKKVFARISSERMPVSPTGWNWK